MRRTDYILISQTLAQALNECRREPVSGVILTIRQFIDNLRIDNRNFEPLQMLLDIQGMVVNERGADAIAKLITECSAAVPEVTEF
jgi:hypothetical protein